MTTNRPEFKAHDDFIFKHKKVGKVTREEFIKYIRSSLEHMRKLSQVIQQYDQTIEDYLNEWDGKFESFDEDVKDLLHLWIQDGTMDHIINENLMSSKADKSYVDDLNENVTAQLAQTKTELSGTNQRIDNLIIPISPENANVEVTDSHVSIVKGKTFDTLGGRLDDIEHDITTHSVTYEKDNNIVKHMTINGDFTDKNTVISTNSRHDHSWRVSADATLINVVHSVVTFKATAQLGRLYSQMIDNSVNGEKRHMYYMFGRFKSTSNQVSLIIKPGSSPEYVMPDSGYHSGSGNFEVVSAVRELPARPNWTMGVADRRESGWDEIEVDYVGMVDLTLLFGEEIPDKEVLDNIIQSIGYSEIGINLSSNKVLSDDIKGIKENIKRIETGNEENPLNYYVPISTKSADGKDIDGFNYVTDMSNDVYMKYDELLALYPEYVTRKLLGNDSSGELPIYAYEFKPMIPEKFTGPYDLKKIIYSSGVHGSGEGGDDHTSVYSLYYFMKDICSHWKGNDILEKLRWNAHFIIIPILNPWGFNNRQRHNFNSVDINRDFRDSTQVETQYIQSLITENNDAVYYCDLHTTGGTGKKHSNDSLIWHSVNENSLIYYLSQQNLGEMTRLWRKKDWLESSDIPFFGYRRQGVNNLTARGWAETHVGIPSSTLEVTATNHHQTRNNDEIIFMMTQVVGVWSLQIFEFFTAKNIYMM